MSPKTESSWQASFSGKMVRNYKLLEFVGSGKIGHVYKGQHKDIPTCIRAVKLVFDKLKPGWQVELEKVTQLALVEGVVQYHESGEDKLSDGTTTHLCEYSVWDFIAPGENLRDYLPRVGQVQVTFLVAVIEQILHVLHACKQRGVARHGDLHSGNILIGDKSLANLDSGSLLPREPIYVSDFGYGATGATTTPKDDYEGLTYIINDIVKRVSYSTATTATDRQVLGAIQADLGRLLKEADLSLRRSPLELLRFLLEIKKAAQADEAISAASGAKKNAGATRVAEASSVGQFQVSEMIGDRWDWWQHLFVPTVPARSKILALDIPTIVTGPRGCGKTMFLRRISERLVVECGAVSDLPEAQDFIAFYVNANDFADAFAHFPVSPTPTDEARLIAYANLCILADVLTVESARSGRRDSRASDDLLELAEGWLLPAGHPPLIIGEDRLERCRTALEQIKWTFPSTAETRFPGYSLFSQFRWLPHLIRQVRQSCAWIGTRSVMVFVDDFSTPRVSVPMQRVLNRLLLQRSDHFLTKVATEAWTTFVPEDSSGKVLQDGDDFQLVDMGEESLFLQDADRLTFLNDLFERRLARDKRVPPESATLRAFLGTMDLSKTEFARRLRSSDGDGSASGAALPVPGDSQRRGPSRPKALYFGDNVFCDLWSGDTRTMIQLVSDVLDQAVTPSPLPTPVLSLPVAPEVQDRVFRTRGGEWLDSHTRNEPTEPDRVRQETAALRQQLPGYSLRGEYGDHLKAVVEAFVAAARQLLLGPVYRIGQREVPRMAFRLEIVDEFRVTGLAREVYRDLIRYGLFLRDSRGKSVRGAFVPRLYLRRLLLPYGALALSKRDSVQMTCKSFVSLLLEPDLFRARLAERAPGATSSDQLVMAFAESPLDPAYDDLSPEETGDPGSGSH